MKIIQTTATRYSGPDVRYNLMLQFLETAAQEKIPVILDDGSVGAFAKVARAAFAERGAKVLVRTTEGIGAPRRNTWAEAMNEGADVIAWSEEKPTFVLKVRELAVRLMRGEADIIIAGRDAASFATYPTFQQQCETVGNRVATLLTGVDADHWYAPRIWKAEMTQYFLDCQKNLWDSVLWPPIEAHAQGHKVIGVALSGVEYPAAQRAEEEGNAEMDLKRWLQLESILATFKEGAERLGLPRMAA